MRREPIAGSGLEGAGIHDLLQTMREEAAAGNPGTAEDADTALLQAAAVAGENAGNTAFSQASNLMSGNFFRDDFAKSRYTQASLNAFRDEQSLSNRLSSTITSVMAAMNYEIAARSARGSDSNVASMVKATAGLRARKAVTLVINKEVQDRSEEELKKSREAMKEAAARAMGSRDAEGTPDLPFEEERMVPVEAAPAAAGEDLPAESRIPERLFREIPLQEPAASPRLGEGESAGGPSLASVSLDVTI